MRLKKLYSFVVPLIFLFGYATGLPFIQFLTPNTLADNSSISSNSQSINKHIIKSQALFTDKAAHSNIPHPNLSHKTKNDKQAPGSPFSVNNPGVNGEGPLTYDGTGKVMTTNHVHLIFWNPGTLQNGTSTTIDNSYYTLIPSYISALSGSSYYNLLTQYYQISGGTKSYVSSTVSFDSTDSVNIDWVTDTRAYPGTSSSHECTGTGWNPVNSNNCVTDTDIQNEIQDVAAELGTNYPTWTQAGYTNSYIVITADGEGSCYAAGTSNASCSYASGGYCSYHNSFTSSLQNQPEIIYNDLPYETSTNTASDSYMGTDGCHNGSSFGTTQSPNSAPGADDVIQSISHEMSEEVTAPDNASWIYTNGDEIADLCQGMYGSVINGSISSQTASDIQLSSTYYYLQELWSNANEATTNPNQVNYEGCTMSNAYPSGSGEIFQSKTVQTGSYPNQTTTVSIVATNAITGANVWSSDNVSGGYKVSLGSSHQLIQSDPVVDPKNGVIYVETNNVYYGTGDLIAVNASSGVTLLDYSLTNVNEQVQPIVDSNGNVYVFGLDNKIYCYQYNSTTQCGTAYTTTITSGNPGFAIDNNLNIIYYPSNDGKVYGVYDKLATNPGTNAFTITPPSSTGHVIMNYAPVLDQEGAGSSIVFATRQTSYPYNYYVEDWNLNSNTSNWNSNRGSNAPNQMTVADNTVLIPAGGVYAIKTSDGSNAWSSEGLGSSNYGTLHAGNNNVYFLGTGSSLLAYNVTSGTQAWSSSSGTYTAEPAVLIYDNLSPVDYVYVPGTKSGTTADFAFNASDTQQFYWTNTNLGNVILSLKSY